MKKTFVTTCQLRISGLLTRLFGQMLHWVILILAYGLDTVTWIVQASRTARQRLADAGSHLHFVTGKLRSLARTYPK